MTALLPVKLLFFERSFQKTLSTVTLLFPVRFSGKPLNQKTDTKVTENYRITVSEVKCTQNRVFHLNTEKGFFAYLLSWEKD